MNAMGTLRQTGQSEHARGIAATRCLPSADTLFAEKAVQCSAMQAMPMLAARPRQAPDHSTLERTDHTGVVRCGPAAPDRLSNMPIRFEQCGASAALVAAMADKRDAPIAIRSREPVGALPWPNGMAARSDDSGPDRRPDRHRQGSPQPLHPCPFEPRSAADRSSPSTAPPCPKPCSRRLLFGHQQGRLHRRPARRAKASCARRMAARLLLDGDRRDAAATLQAKASARAAGTVKSCRSDRTKAGCKVDVRIIACANRDLPTEVAEGRSSAQTCSTGSTSSPWRCAPLRERVEDIAPLAFALALRHTPANRAMPWLSDSALAMLKLHGWPGNVRELENVVRRALLLAGDADTITPAHIVFDGPARLVNGAIESQSPRRKQAACPTIVQLSGSPRNHRDTGELRR